MPFEVIPKNQAQRFLLDIIDIVVDLEEGRDLVMIPAKADRRTRVCLEQPQYLGEEDVFEERCHPGELSPDINKRTCIEIRTFQALVS